MMSMRQKCERFLLHMDEISRKSGGQIWLSPDEVGATIECTRHDCLKIVALLEDKKWIVSQAMPEGMVRIRLTLDGHDEAERLTERATWPCWRLWLDKYGRETWVVALSGLVLALVLEFLKRTFWQ